MVIGLFLRELHNRNTQYIRSDTLITRRFSKISRKRGVKVLWLVELEEETAGGDGEGGGGHGDTGDPGWKDCAPPGVEDTRSNRDCYHRWKLGRGSGIKVKEAVRVRVII